MGFPAEFAGDSVGPEGRGSGRPAQLALPAPPPIPSAPVSTTPDEGMGSRGDREVAHPQPSSMPVPPTAGPAEAVTPVTPAEDGGSKGDDSSSSSLFDDESDDDLAELVKHEEKRQNELKAAGAKSKSSSKD